MGTDNIEQFPRVELDLPLELEEAFKIQEALKPLGYEVSGYFKKHRTCRTVIYLTRIVSYNR
jgi:hypothetical protein